MPSRANASLLQLLERFYSNGVKQVSMPSRANASLLLSGAGCIHAQAYIQCQCPLGLMPHCYV